MLKNQMELMESEKFRPTFSRLSLPSKFHLKKPLLIFLCTVSRTFLYLLLGKKQHENGTSYGIKDIY